MAGIIASTRTMVGESVLSYKFSRIQRNKALINLMDASSVGLVYQVADEQQFNSVKKMIKDLSNDKRQIMALGFVDDITIPDYCVAAYSGYYFNKKALNWFQAPKSDYIITFINKEYDILIDLSNTNQFVIKYIVALSNARFKVGRQRKGYEKYFDLMLRMKRKATMMDFMEQAIHYLTVLKSK